MATMHKNENIKIALLGASFDTGNMGVSALAESNIKCIIHRWPDAEVVLFSGRLPCEHRLTIKDKEVSIKKLPVRICKNVFLPNHFCVIFVYALLLRIFRCKRFRQFCVRLNPYLKEILEIDIVADITAGDSFSDVYGMRRFVLGFLYKWLLLLFDKPLILLPQTYGPFGRPLAKTMAAYILRKSKVLFCRDKDSADYAKKLLGDQNFDDKVRFCPDVAFVLDTREPENIDIAQIKNFRSENTIVVGLNVSGLLYNGGYTQNNMFGLKVDYRDLVQSIIGLLLRKENAVVLLIPHVFPPPGLEVESDADACLQVYNNLKEKFKSRIFVTPSKCNHNEIKYIIGMCDFFIGSRMHACIAALSQCIPAIGLAYSKKFRGVFETIGAEQFVVDMRNSDTEEILTTVSEAFEQREVTVGHLKAVIPRVQQQILNVFEDIS